jgi:DNA-binding LacI/PurR family transcriptional regulator
VAALKEQGLVMDDDYVVDLLADAPDFSAGYRACLRLLSLRRRPTAILCYNDAMAMGCLRAAHERRVPVPTQLSIVGHDDLPFAEYTVPPLSTVIIDRVRLGTLAARLFLALMRGEPAATEAIRTTYLQRDTVAPPALDLPP